jgi:hypothetical protein
MSNPLGPPERRDLIVNPEQKTVFRRLLGQPRSSRSLTFRARVILECVRGQNNRQAAYDGLHPEMWGNCLITGGIAGLGMRCDWERHDRSVMTVSSGPCPSTWKSLT